MKFVSELIGRLGNQMFEICVGKTIASQFGYDYVGAWMPSISGSYINDKQDNFIIKTVLRNVNFVDDNYIINNNFVGFPYTDSSSFLENNVLLFPQNNIVWKNYSQCYKYVNKDIARLLFKPYVSIKKHIYELYGDLSDFACIHIRRGDYLNLQDVGFKVYTKQDIENIISNYFNDCKIMFVSDDLKWCKENFKGDKYYFADKNCRNHVEMDLYIQTQCKQGNVVSASSFSWWGAFLNEYSNKVVCPYPWFRNNFENGGNYIIPDSWIKYKK